MGEEVKRSKSILFPGFGVGIPISVVVLFSTEGDVVGRRHPRRVGRKRLKVFSREVCEAGGMADGVTRITPAFDRFEARISIGSSRNCRFSNIADWMVSGLSDGFFEVLSGNKLSFVLIRHHVAVDFKDFLASVSGATCDKTGGCSLDDIQIVEGCVACSREPGFSCIFDLRFDEGAIYVGKVFHIGAKVSASEFAENAQGVASFGFGRFGVRRRGEKSVQGDSKEARVLDDVDRVIFDFYDGFEVCFSGTGGENSRSAFLRSKRHAPVRGPVMDFGGDSIGSIGAISERLSLDNDSQVIRKKEALRIGWKVIRQVVDKDVEEERGKDTSLWDSCMKDFGFAESIVDADLGSSLGEEVLDPGRSTRRKIGVDEFVEKSVSPNSVEGSPHVEEEDIGFKSWFLLISVVDDLIHS